MSTPVRSAAILLFPLALGLAFSGCGKKAAEKATNSATGLIASATGQSDREKFAKAGSLLLKAMTEPTAPLHLSYKAQAQINPKFPMDEKAKPEVGPVTMEADVSPDEITVESLRGGKKASTTARKDKQLEWAMSKLALLGPIGDVSMTMAFASPVAKPVGTEVVGGAEADRFDFDTRAAGVAEKTGIATAQEMLQGRVKIEAIHGTASVDKASGRLAKFSFDTDLSDKSGNTWTEHHEGEVTPRK